MSRVAVGRKIPILCVVGVVIGTAASVACDDTDDVDAGVQEPSTLDANKAGYDSSTSEDPPADVDASHPKDASSGDANADASHVSDASDASDGAHTSDGSDASDGGDTVDVNDAGTTGDAGISNLLPNGTFDTDCSSWGAYNATLTSDPNGRSGSGCRVCLQDPAGGGFTIDSYMFGPSNVSPGSIYTAKVWVRSVPDSTIPIDAAMILHSFNGSNTTIESNTSSVVALTDSWQPLEATLSITTAADFLSLYAGTTVVAPGACFLIDDVVITKTK